MIALVLIIAALTATLPSSTVAIDYSLPDRLFLQARAGQLMSIDNTRHKFSIDKKTPSHGIVIYGTLNGEEKIKYAVDSIDLARVEKLFMWDSRGCDGESIDLILQLSPENAEDKSRRRYYRFMFSRDLKTVINEFYDPSIEAMYAVLPIQTVEDIPSPLTGKKITCKNGIPTVE